MPTLEFKGKSHIYAYHLTAPYRPLRVDPSRSMIAEGQADAALTDQNLIIHGDNLHALKALLPHYGGRVKCIYIDPPYNTGNEKWVYNDRVNSPLMQAWFKRNSPVDGEDLERHDKWLCMMWPRLHLLRELLRDDGVIFVSIDDNEVHHLRMLMDEIFGEENFRNEISVRRYDKNISNQFASNGMKSLAVGFERVLAYAKSSACLFNPIYRPATDVRQNSGYWKGFHNSANRPTMRYELLGVTPQRGQWKWQEAVALKAVQNYEEYKENHYGISLEEYWEHTGKTKRFIRRRPELTTGQNKGVEHWIPPSKGVLLSSNWFDIIASERDLRSLGIDFDTPKRMLLIKRLITMCSSSKICSNDCEIILDSFAGSGTTAHAVLAQNKEDGGSRRFILIECEDYADTITAERVRRVIQGAPDAKDRQLREGLGGSFAYCTLGDPLDADSLLKGQNLPSFSDLAAYLLYTATGISASPHDLAANNADGHFHADGKRDYYLIYEPKLAFLRGNGAALNLERAKRIHSRQRPAMVFAPAKFISQRQLSEWDITFCQLPYELMAKAGG